MFELFIDHGNLILDDIQGGLLSLLALFLDKVNLVGRQLLIVFILVIIAD